MLNSLRERIFPFLIAVSALSVSASAAYYSVTGLSMLFAGASFAVMVMAASLEVAKLVIASILYQYRKTLPKLLKTYLTIAAAILILITSAGIYGYLSAAYQKTSDKTSVFDSRIAVLESKKKLYEENRDNILKEKQSIASLQGNLSQSPTTQYTDRNGNLVVRSNTAALRNIESSSKANERLSKKIDVINDSIFSVESKILEIKTTSVGESELGPLRYISKILNKPMDKIINWYILVIIFVFDPLAIALVIAANFAFAQIPKREEQPLKEKVKDMKKVVKAYDDLEDEMKEWEKASLEDYQDWEEQENNNFTPIVEEKPIEEPKKDQPIPVFVDPKTGKLYYEEPDAEPEIEIKMSGEPSLDILKEEFEVETEKEVLNLDLDGDGIVEEEEIKEVFDNIDINNDGVIDEQEAQQANINQETSQALNEANEIFSKIDSSIYYPNLVQVELERLKELVSKYLGKKKDDDNTITYF